jgi:hypothetical protein
MATKTIRFQKIIHHIIKQKITINKTNIIYLIIKIEIKFKNIIT